MPNTYLWQTYFFLMKIKLPLTIKLYRLVAAKEINDYFKKIPKYLIYLAKTFEKTRKKTSIRYAKEND